MQGFPILINNKFQIWFCFLGETKLLIFNILIFAQCQYNDSVFITKISEDRQWLQQLNGGQDSNYIAVIGFQFQLCIQLRFFLMHMQEAVARAPVFKLRWNSGLFPSAWLSLSNWRYFRSETEDGKSLPFSYLSSVFRCAILLNKKIKF